MEPRIKQQLIAGGLVVAVILGILGVLLSGRTEVPEIISANTEADGDSFIARPTTVIELDQAPEDGSLLFLNSFPSFSYEIDVAGSTVTVTPQEDLADGTPYKLTLFFAPDEESDREEVGVHEFRTAEFAQRREFLNSLPRDFDGFTVFRIGERTIYVSINPTQGESKRPAVEKLLSDNGITEDEFSIDIDIAGEAADEGLILH